MLGSRWYFIDGCVTKRHGLLRPHRRLDPARSVGSLSAAPIPLTQRLRLCWARGELRLLAAPRNLRVERVTPTWRQPPQCGQRFPPGSSSWDDHARFVAGRPNGTHERVHHLAVQTCPQE